MYILRNKDNKIIACAKGLKAISDAKIFANCPDGVIEKTDEEIIQNGSDFYLKSEFDEYKKTEEYKYDAQKKDAENEILQLKKELESEDYKVIKAFEANLLSKECPYDIETLARERKTKRERINELEHQFVF